MLFLLLISVIFSKSEIFNACTQLYSYPYMKMGHLFWVILVDRWYSTNEINEWGCQKIFSQKTLLSQLSLLLGILQTSSCFERNMKFPCHT